MRGGEKAAIILVAVELAVAVCSFFILPDTIAKHWGIEGTSYGSRFYVFGVPVLAAIITAAAIMFSRWYVKRDPVEGETLYYVMLFVSFMMIFVGFLGIFLILAANL